MSVNRADERWEHSNICFLKIALIFYNRWNKDKSSNWSVIQDSVCVPANEQNRKKPTAVCMCALLYWVLMWELGTVSASTEFTSVTVLPLIHHNHEVPSEIFGLLKVLCFHETLSQIVVHRNFRALDETYTVCHYPVNSHTNTNNEVRFSCNASCSFFSCFTVMKCHVLM